MLQINRDRIDLTLDITQTVMDPWGTVILTLLFTINQVIIDI